MRRDRREELRRKAQLETFEERLTFAAQPLGDALLPPPVEQYGQLDQAPDFVLDESLLESAAASLTPLLDEAHEITGVRQVHDMGLDGSGQTVVVIDSGIAWDHEALGGGLGSSYQVVGGWDFAENDANPYDDGPRGFHGTHVAGIIGSNDRFDTGVAPGADLVSLRVFSDNGEGMFEWVEQALQWVHEHRDDFDNPVTTVNLSLGASWNADTVPSWAMLEEELSQLESDGIFISVAAGNSFRSFGDPGLAYPAASPHVVPVASVNDNNVLSSFSQRSERALLAPGQSIMSTIPDHATTAKDGRVNDFGVASGTSMAAPYVAGTAVLVRQAMELAGYENITQDTIYDHLYATADPVYDSVTSATYQRINVLAAIEALEPQEVAPPADDYGDTASSAHYLGAVGEAAAVNGTLGHAGDTDYFSFTAAATGTATVHSTSSVSPRWTLPGGAARLGDSISFDVQSGQSYRFALTGGDAVGDYRLQIGLEHSAAEAAHDLGRVELTRLDGQSVAGSASYGVTAVRDGVLAVAVDDGLQVAIYQNGVRLASGSSQTQAAATEGQSYEIRVLGHDSSFELAAANQVYINSGNVNVYGVDGADDVSLDVVAGQLQVNGLDYDVSGQMFTIYGGAGLDRLHVSGNRWAGTLNPSVTQLSTAGVSVFSAGFEQVEVDAESGSVAMFGADGDDQLQISASQSSLTGAGYSLVARGFQSTVALGRGGDDSATLVGTAASETLHAWAGRTQLRGGGRTQIALGFETVHVSAGGGVLDRAYLYDTAGDDRYTATAGRAAMEAGGVVTTATGFDRAYGVASEGFDIAVLDDTAGEDRFTSLPTQSYLSGAGYFVHARGFDSVSARATRGGIDRATFHDSAGADRFIAMPNYASMRGAGFQNTAQGFDQSTAVAHNGGRDELLLYDSTGDDHLVVDTDGVELTGDGYRVSARQFEVFRAYATRGGNDTGELNGDWNSQQDGEQLTVTAPSVSGLTRGFVVQLNAAPLSLATLQLSDAELAALPVVDSRGIDLRMADRARQSVFAEAAEDDAPLSGSAADSLDDPQTAGASERDLAFSGDDDWSAELAADELA